MKYLTFGSEKDKLRMVVENGVDASDSRVMTRTNEATQLILAMQHPQTGEPLIPIHGMTFALVQVVDGFFDLPPGMESAIHVEQNETDGTLAQINGQTDVTQGFYNIINPFTYLDPTLAHDNPFVDFGLNPSTTDSTQLVRRYFYPGFDHGRILIIGPKSYMPITADADYLIVQNVPALKRMIQSVEYTENNQIEAGQKLYDMARDIITAEIKKYNTDPRFVMNRKGNYESDLATFQQGSMGWTRAMLALQVPGALNVGKHDIRRLIDRAQLRMMTMGAYKGTLEEFNATITDGFIYTPSRVETIIAASLEGATMDVRSIFYKYIDMGGCGNSFCSCGCSGGRLEDAGEVFFPNSGDRRRKYRAYVGTAGSEVAFVAKLRWEAKKADEQLVIQNFEANRLMVSEIMAEDAGNWDGSEAAEMKVKRILDKELREYLAGIQQIFPRIATASMRSLGGVL